MNRHHRRESKAIMQRIKTSSTTSGDFMKYAVAGMAGAGTEIVQQLRAAVGDRAYTSGEALDGLMQVAARMEAAMLLGNPSEFSRAAIAVLFLARDIATLENVIKPMTDVPQA